MDTSSTPASPLSVRLLAAADHDPSVRFLSQKLEAIPDPRVDGRVKHRLHDVLLAALCAMLCDCDDYVAMATFAQTQLDWLRRYVPLVNGPPSHDVFRNVLMMIQPATLLDITSAWVGALGGKHVCIDGKVSRGVKDPQSGRSRLHLLRAWVDEASLSVGQAVCGEKSNELATLPTLLASLQLQGAVVSIDAMAGHPEVARSLNEAGADYVLALKANEKETLQIVAAHFKSHSGQTPENAPQGMAHITDILPPEAMSCEWSKECHRVTFEEKNCGRYEERQVITTAVGDWMPKAYLWYGLHSVVCVVCVIRRSMRQRHSGDEPTMQVHYYLSSLPPEGVGRIAQIIRGHWSVENSCHHLLDVTYHEDHCQVRDETAAQNLSLLREISAKLLRDHPRKDSIRAKRKRCALCAAFRSEVADPVLSK